MLTSICSSRYARSSTVLFIRIFLMFSFHLDSRKGTGALKTDYTRTGKRSARGMLEDGLKSVVRIYYKNFVDGGRQDAIDALCGYASARDPPNGGSG